MSAAATPRGGVAEELLRRTAGSTLGRRIIQAAIRRDPSLAFETLGPVVNRPASFDTAPDQPERLEGFESLAFMFASNPLNWGIALLMFDEAAYLYSLAKRLGPARGAEIGRFKGGSTFVLASALAPGSLLTSYDLHVKLTGQFDGKQLDASLQSALDRYHIADRVELLVGDSRVVEPPAPLDFVLIDGDHCYEGAKADYLHWRDAVRPGGHLLFHDGAAPKPLQICHPEVQQLVGEIARDDTQFTRVGGAGTIVHFVKHTDGDANAT